MWFTKGKECPKGDNCDFAHGLSELKEKKGLK